MALFNWSSNWLKREINSWLKGGGGSAGGVNPIYKPCNMRYQSAKPMISIPTMPLIKKCFFLIEKNLLSSDVGN